MWPIAAATRGLAFWRTLGRDRRGSAAVEMGLVAPALFTFLLGIGWFGYGYWLQNALDFAVTNAARCATVDTDPTTGKCDSVAHTQSYAAGASGASFDSSVFTVTLDTACFGAGSHGNQVTGNYTLAAVIPFVSVTLNLSSQACYPK